MFLHQLELSPEARAREIVELDHRTADVFQRYGIHYCCGMQFPLRQVCEVNNISIDGLFADLQEACYNRLLPAQTAYDKWPVDFLIDYIINVHHQYLSTALPSLDKSIADFVKEHGNKLPSFEELHEQFRMLASSFSTHMKEEEESIFPYLRQVAHAYHEDESWPFARLLVKTLGKPLANMMEREHRLLTDSIACFRRLTNNYSIRTGACTSQKVLLGKLKDFDNDLVQHYYLENEILIPKVIAMEKELLLRNH